MTTTATVALLALIAGVVSFGHMHELARNAGEGPFTAALIPFSVDGMIVASSMSLLVDSRSGRRGGVLPWTLLVLGSVASLAANVATAIPSVEGRVIAAWPSFALMGAYELLMRQVRHTAGELASEVTRQSTGEAADRASADAVPSAAPAPVVPATATAPVLPRRAVVAGGREGEAEARQKFGCVSRSRGRMRLDSRRLTEAESLQQRAYVWAQENRADDGTLPTGRMIAERFGRSPRWGRLIKQDVAAEIHTDSIALAG